MLSEPRVLESCLFGLGVQQSVHSARLITGDPAALMYQAKVLLRVAPEMAPTLYGSHPPVWALLPDPLMGADPLAGLSSAKLCRACACSMVRLEWKCI